MNKNVKKFTLFLVLLGLFTIVRFPYQHFGKSIYQRIQTQLAKESIILSAREAKLSFPALLMFSEATLKFPRLGLRFPESNGPGLLIEQAIFQLKILPLFLLRQELSANFKALGGLGNFLISKSMTNDVHALDFSIEQIALEKLPIHLEGSLRGRINIQGKISGEQALGAGLHSLMEREVAEIKFNLSDADYSGGDKISGLVVIPAVENIKIEAEASLESGEISVDYLSAFSSLGSAKGDGTLGLNKDGQLSSALFKLDIDLTDEGAKSFAGYLALAANISPETTHKSWTLVIEKKNQQQLPLVRAKVR